MSFNWLFSLIVGGFILFFALYAASQFVKTSQKTTNTEIAASILSLFDPLETGVASGKSSQIDFVKQSQLVFDCSPNQNIFGEQRVRFFEKTFGDAYGEAGERISIKDKYVFVEDSIQGKSLYYFSKPYFAGFKVADLLMLYSDEQTYCVYDANEDFMSEVSGLNLKQIIFMNATTRCEGIRVCFGSNQKNCAISVFENEGYVLKENKKLYYTDNLLFGAIFSSPQTYECNVQRLKHRFDALAQIYLGKIEVIQRSSCSVTLGPILLGLVDFQIDSSKDLSAFQEKVKEMDAINKRAKDGCKVYYDVG